MRCVPYIGERAKGIPSKTGHYKSDLILPEGSLEKYSILTDINNLGGINKPVSNYSHMRPHHAGRARWTLKNKILWKRGKHVPIAVRTSHSSLHFISYCLPSRRAHFFTLVFFVRGKINTASWCANRMPIGMLRKRRKPPGHINNGENDYAPSKRLLK